MTPYLITAAALVIAGVMWLYFRQVHRGWQRQREEYKTRIARQTERVTVLDQELSEARQEYSTLFDEATGYIEYIGMLSDIICERTSEVADLEKGLVTSHLSVNMCMKDRSKYKLREQLKEVHDE